MDHAEKVALLVPISEMVDRMQPCGSRVTCNPPPMDTDEDYLLLIEADGGGRDGPSGTRVSNLEYYLRQNGWEVGGSLPTDIEPPVREDEKFRSWTYGPLNLIVSESATFFQRFMAATAICKRLNLMNKADRIAVFQAVLYGNEVEKS